MQVKDGNQLEIALAERPQHGDAGPASQQPKGRVLFQGRVVDEIPNGDREYVLLRNTRTGELRLERLASMTKMVRHVRRPEPGAINAMPPASGAQAAPMPPPPRDGADKTVPDEIKHVRREDYEVFDTEGDMGCDPLDIVPDDIEFLMNNILDASGASQKTRESNL